jgi:phage tail sheath gpL-like
MGFAVDNTTADIVYVEHGATCKVLTATTAGGVLTLYVGAVTLGSYTVVAGDSVEEVMQGLTDAINADYTTHQVKAIFDGEQIVLADNELLTYSTLQTGVGVGITIEKTNFTAWSTQFDWENDIESMVEISEIMLDIMGISNRDTNIVQWAEKEKAQ